MPKRMLKVGNANNSSLFSIKLNIYFMLNFHINVDIISLKCNQSKSYYSLISICQWHKSILKLNKQMKSLYATMAQSNIWLYNNTLLQQYCVVLYLAHWFGPLLTLTCTSSDIRFITQFLIKLLKHDRGVVRMMIAFYSLIWLILC